MDAGPPVPPSQAPQGLPLLLPPPPTIVPLRPNLGNWTQHDHHRLRHALGRIPSWDIPTLAAAIAKPPVEVVWHLSTVHAATLAEHQAPDVALNPLQSLLVGFNPGTRNGGEQDTAGSESDEFGDSTDEWESDQDETFDEDRQHERQNPYLYAQESDRAAITKEEDTSTRSGRKLDKLLIQLNQERPLSLLYKRKLGVFYRSRITKIMSHHHNNATPLTVLNDTWLDLYQHLTTFIRTRLAAAYNHAYTRLQSTHKHGTCIVVDQLLLTDMHAALALCAATSMPNGSARALADRQRARDLAHWWHTDYLPAHPNVREEMSSKIERMFRDRGIEWRQVRAWRPNEGLLARLDHVFAKARRARKHRRSRTAFAADATSGSEASGEGCSDGSSGSDDERGSDLRLSQLKCGQRWMDASMTAEPIKLPNPQGLFHVDALVSIQDDPDDQEEWEEDEEDELEQSATEHDGQSSDSDRDEHNLDSDGLPRSGQRARHIHPPRSPTPPPLPHYATIQGGATLQSHHVSQFSTPAADFTPRWRPIRFRVGVDAGDDPMDLVEPPTILRSSRRAKRPLLPDVSPSRSNARSSRWKDAGAEMDEEGEGEDREGDEDDQEGGAGVPSQMSDIDLPDPGASWNGRKVKRLKLS